MSELTFENNGGKVGFIGKIIKNAKRKILGEGSKMKKTDKTIA